jgi:hypothetical protein
MASKTSIDLESTITWDAFYRSCLRITGPSGRPYVRLRADLVKKKRHRLKYGPSAISPTAHTNGICQSDRIAYKAHVPCAGEIFP